MKEKRAPPWDATQLCQIRPDLFRPHLGGKSEDGEGNSQETTEKSREIIQ